MLVCFLIALASCSPEQGDTPDTQKNQTASAPDFELTSLSGETVRLSSLRGKLVVLNFWATWCPPCREEMPSMQRLHELMPADRFILLAVNIEAQGRQPVADFVKTHPVGFTILLDETGQARSLYGVAKYPETFIIDPQGQVVEKVIGGMNWSEPRVVNYLRSLLPSQSH
nr:TlpA disulfide reductase family protein [uncultured Desulfuromonas sp.]